MRHTPQTQILSFLMNGGMLTVTRAQRLFHTTELRRIVSRLRKKGYPICAERQSGMTKDGRAIRYKEYYIPVTGITEAEKNS